MEGWKKGGMKNRETEKERRQEERNEEK